MPAIAEPPQPRAYARKTSPAVKLVDRLTSTLITVGGIMVIVAVLGIMVYLGSVVVPLFRGAKIGAPQSYPLFSEAETGQLLFVELNEYKTYGLALDRSGALRVFDAHDGKIIERSQVTPAEPRITAFARTLTGGRVAFGFADGTIRLGAIRFNGENAAVTLDEPVTVGKSPAPIALLSYKTSDTREVLTALKTDGELILNEVARRENMVTGKVALRLTKHELPYEVAATPPAFLLQTGQGDQLYLAWPDGTTRRYDLRQIAKPVVAETIDLVRDPQAQLTDLRFMFGEQSLVASDSRGGVTSWFRVENAAAKTADSYHLIPAHELTAHADSVSVVAVSTRDKGLLSATSQGEIFLRHLTSEQVLGRVRLPEPVAISHLQLTPKADGIFAVDARGGAWLWNVDNPHPETTWRTIFGKVWYEGYPEPTYTWQSSSGNDDFEPKFSLIPLMFGTLKATIYSLSFAIPIALLAAIYTAEFLDKKWRPVLKSGIETMASLPSVVLGFVAALVLAPIVENWVMAVLAAFAVVPLVVLTCGYIWQMLPQRVIVRYSGWPQFLMVLVAVVLALLLTQPVGVQVERVVFSGDFKGWLDGRVGTGAPWIAVIVWPWCLLALWFLQRRLATTTPAHRVRAGLLELTRFLATILASVLLAALIGHVLAATGLDPRGSLVGTYVQRNTLVVGFVMGFAVIPIIYTISEDALSTVPEHLRSASLGCGATRWQTAVRVVVPVAMSGIFSGMMIGLGRAVGETMIVVMAAGNTPVMDANIFNGLRALSANIAVELPEAVKDSTLFRMLFLAALTLFVMTFLINTVAEIIRMRFRRRAYQL